MAGSRDKGGREVSGWFEVGPVAESSVSAGWRDGAWRGWPAPVSIVRGESRHQPVLRGVCGEPREAGWCVPVAVALVREPDNPHDPNAIYVEVAAEPVGYLAREVAAELAPLIDAQGAEGLSVPGVVRGGWLDGENFGVCLWLEERVGPGLSVRQLVSLPEAGNWDPAADEEREWEAVLERAAELDQMFPPRKKRWWQR